MKNTKTIISFSNTTLLNRAGMTHSGLVSKRDRVLPTVVPNKPIRTTKTFVLEGVSQFLAVLLVGFAVILTAYTIYLVIR